MKIHVLLKKNSKNHWFFIEYFEFFNFFSKFPRKTIENPKSFNKKIKVITTVSYLIENVTVKYKTMIHSQLFSSCFHVVCYFQFLFFIFKSSIIIWDLLLVQWSKDNKKQTSHQGQIHYHKEKKLWWLMSEQKACHILD